MEASDIPASLQEIYHQKVIINVEGQNGKGCKYVIPASGKHTGSRGKKIKNQLLLRGCGLPSADLRIICIPDF